MCREKGIEMKKYIKKQLAKTALTLFTSASIFLSNAGFALAKDNKISTPKSRICRSIIQNLN